VRRVLLTLAVLAIVAGAAVGGYAIRAASTAEASPPSTVATATAKVVRTDLVQTQTLAGTLRYSEPSQLLSPASGTVTSLPREASRIGRNDAALELDGKPVYAFIGERPVWRPFAKGMTDGPDVVELEKNLAALGYGDPDWVPDSEFDSDTAQAIEDWRSDVGLDDGRSIELGRVVFIPTEVRVGALDSDLGRIVAPGAPLYEVSSFEQEVVIELDPTDIDLVSPRAAVKVKLPDDREIMGTIVNIGRVVVASGPEPAGAGVIEVTVHLDGNVPEFDEAPVDVDVESDRARGVLAVPVRALLALSDGGYAVEVSGRLIKVTTGDFADGLVEVEGALSEGDEVVIPK
jgi:hypothetical protein